MKEESLRSLKIKLDECHQWPCRFMFKFIAPQDKINQLMALFAETPFSTRSSKNARFISLTVELEMQSSDEVIEVYRRAGEIDGVMAL
jgi:uncharacterized protein